MPRNVRLALLGLIAALAVLVFEHWWRPTPPEPVRTTAPRQAADSSPAAAVDRTVGFRSAALLAEHFRKHGREFGALDASAYQRMAQELRDRPAGGEVLEAVRADGVITRFDRASGAFIAYDPDRTIRTFFRPRDGVAYFERQKRRVPGGLR